MWNPFRKTEHKEIDLMRVYGDNCESYGNRIARQIQDLNAGRFTVREREGRVGELILKPFEERKKAEEDIGKLYKNFTAYEGLQFDSLSPELKAKLEREKGRFVIVHIPGYDGFYAAPENKVNS